MRIVRSADPDAMQVAIGREGDRHDVIGMSCQWTKTKIAGDDIPDLQGVVIGAGDDAVGRESD